MGNSWDVSTSLTKKDRLTGKLSWEHMEKDSVQVSHGLFSSPHWPRAEGAGSALAARGKCAFTCWSRSGSALVTCSQRWALKPPDFCRPCSLQQQTRSPNVLLSLLKPDLGRSGKWRLYNQVCWFLESAKILTSSLAHLGLHTCASALRYSPWGN